MPSELKKYILRFLHLIVIALPIFFFSQVAQHFDVILYKLMMASIALGFTEFVWAFGFKPHVRGIINVEERKAVWHFRAVLYFAIIAGFMLGL